MQFVCVFVLLGLVASRMKPIMDKESEFLKEVMQKDYNQVASLSQTNAVNDKTQKHVSANCRVSHMIGSDSDAYCDAYWRQKVV